MFAKKSIFLVSLILFVVLMMTSSASANPLEAALGTGFTYQGKLTDGDEPANGAYDLQFALYDALSGGSPVGSTVSKEDVTVTADLFTVQLDFGDVFDGTALYLEIGVRPGASVGAYTTLTPRQPITPAPYASYAANAPWSGLTGVPVGFVDGVDDNTTYTAGKGLQLTGTQFQGKGSPYQNMVIVAKSGGDFTTITAALNSITDASASNPYLIYVAPGVYTERVTMKQYVDIEGAGELTTKITYAGAAAADTGTVVGANNAELRFLMVENTGGAGLYPIAIYNNNASPRLTHITAITLGGTHNYSVYNYSFSSPTMTHITATASGGVDSNNGVYNYSSSSPTMTDVNASASGGTNSYGVVNQNSSLPTMTDVTASASGGTNNSIGVYNIQSWGSSFTMTNVTASALGAVNNNYGVYNQLAWPTMKNITASASGGLQSHGIYNHDFSSPIMTNIIANASGGADSNNGVFNYQSSPTMTDITASASGGTNNSGIYNDNGSWPIMTNITASASGGTNSYGLYIDLAMSTVSNSNISASGGINNYGIYNHHPSASYCGNCSVQVNNSQISGSTNTIRNDIQFNTRIGATLLNGGAVAVYGGILTCAGVYDENYVFYASTCP